MDSKPNEGSRFSLLIPFELVPSSAEGSATSHHSDSAVRPRAKQRNSSGSGNSSSSAEIDNLVQALSTSHMRGGAIQKPTATSVTLQHSPRAPSGGSFGVADSRFPIRSLKVDEFDVDKEVESSQFASFTPTPQGSRASPRGASSSGTPAPTPAKLRFLIVEVNEISPIALRGISNDTH